MMAGGRLSTAHQSMVTDHIRRCSTCSARFNKMKVACAVFERISEDGLNGVRRVNRSSAPGRFEIDPAFPWRLICGIIAGCVLVMFALFNRQVIPSANASELLDDAVRNEGQSKSAYLYEMSVDGMVCLAKQNNDTLVSLNRAPSCGGIVRRIQATPWGHGNPLSARTFRTWRYSLGKLQQTRVTGVDPVEIETTARQGRVSVASIYLRHFDYHPTKVVLRFDDQQIVTVSEGRRTRTYCCWFVRECTSTSSNAPLRRTRGSYRNIGLGDSSASRRRFRLDCKGGPTRHSRRCRSRCGIRHGQARLHSGLQGEPRNSIGLVYDR